MPDEFDRLALPDDSNEDESLKGMTEDELYQLTVETLKNVVPGNSPSKEVAKEFWRKIKPWPTKSRQAEEWADRVTCEAAAIKNIEEFDKIELEKQHRIVMEGLEMFAKEKTRNDAVAGKFITSWDHMAETVHAQAVEKGLWEDNPSDGEIIALLHSELSEALEALRNGNPPSEKIPDFSCLEEELADEVLRIMSYAVRQGLQLGHAIVAKHAFNETRPLRHGKKF